MQAWYSYLSKSFCFNNMEKYLWQNAKWWNNINICQKASGKYSKLLATITTKWGNHNCHFFLSTFLNIPVYYKHLTFVIRKKALKISLYIKHQKCLWIYLAKTVNKTIMLFKWYLSFVLIYYTWHCRDLASLTVASKITVKYLYKGRKERLRSSVSRR